MNKRLRYIMKVEMERNFKINLFRIKNKIAKNEPDFETNEKKSILKGERFIFRNDLKRSKVFISKSIYIIKSVPFLLSIKNILL